MKRFLGVILLLILLVGVTGCGLGVKDTVDNAQTVETERIMQESNNRIGMPDITNFYEKALLKDLYELRDDSELICYAYTRNEFTGKYVYEGMCIGYGLPYAVQYSNPEKLIDVTDFGISSYQSNDSANMPQAEPNGLFMPDALSATWVIMINEDGKREPAYYEPTIVVRQTKIRVQLCEEWSLPTDYVEGFIAIEERVEIEIETEEGE